MYQFKKIGLDETLENVFLYDEGEPKVNDICGNSMNCDFVVNSPIC